MTHVKDDLHDVLETMRSDPAALAEWHIGVVVRAINALSVTSERADAAGADNARFRSALQHIADGQDVPDPHAARTEIYDREDAMEIARNALADTTPHQPQPDSNAPITDPEAVYRQIEHGDDAHRDWLHRACHAIARGEPVPEPSGSGTAEHMQRVCDAALEEAVQWHHKQAGIWNTPTGPCEHPIEGAMRRVRAEWHLECVHNLRALKSGSSSPEGESDG